MIKKLTHRVSFLILPDSAGQHMEDLNVIWREVLNPAIAVLEEDKYIYFMSFLLFLWPSFTISIRFGILFTAIGVWTLRIYHFPSHHAKNETIRHSLRYLMAEMFGLAFLCYVGFWQWAYSLLK